MKTVRCMLYVTGFIACLLAQQNAWALFGWGKLTVYSCKTEQDAMACNARCEPQNKQMEFEINVDTSVVLLKLYENGELSKSGKLERCSVANNKNWQCGEGYQFSISGSTIDKKVMVDGTLHIISKLSYEPVAKYACAKR